MKSVFRIVFILLECEKSGQKNIFPQSKSLYQIFHIKATIAVEKKYIYISIIYIYKNVHYADIIFTLIVSDFYPYTICCGA